MKHTKNKTIHVILYVLLTILMSCMVSAVQLSFADNVMTASHFSNNTVDETGTYDLAGVGTTFANDKDATATSAIAFGGGDDRVGTNVTRPDSDFSISIWAENDDVTQQRVYFADRVFGAAWSGFEIKQSGTANKPHFRQFSTGPVESTATGSAMTNNVWVHLVATYDYVAEDCKIYQNGVLIDTDATCPSDTALSPIFMGVVPDLSQDFIGTMDELLIMNKSLNITEVLELYNGTGAYDTWNLTAPPVPLVDSSIISLLFSNKTDVSNYKLLFDEGEDFNIFVNWTNITGSPLNESFGNCSITVQNGLVEVDATDNNFTICGNVACDYPIGYEEQFGMGSTVNAINDIVHFDACHGNLLQGDVIVDWQCEAISDTDTILAIEMPLCTLGTARIMAESNVCNGSSEVNITVSYLGTLNRFKTITNLAVDREYTVDVNEYSAEVFFNSSIDLWVTNHSHEFYEHGSKKIWANCTATNTNYSNSTTTNITIVNVPPVIFIEQVNTSLGITTLTDGVVIEYAYGVWNWFGAIIDDDPDTLNVSWYNSSGQSLLSFQGSALTTALNTPNQTFVAFVAGNTYSINVTVNDTAGRETNASFKFNVTDSSNPTCNFVGQYFIDNTTFNMNITCSDENFFSINVTCPVNNQSNFTTGLNVNVFNLLDDFEITVRESCSFRYCDGHTRNNLLKYWDAYTSESRIQITANYVRVADIWTDTPGGIVSYDVIDDRIKYNFDMSSSITDEFTFYVNTSVNTHYLRSDKYKGWLVINNEYWLDFNSDQLDETDKVKVKKLSDGLYEVTIKTKDKNIQFESIGELNCVEGSFYVTPAFQYTLQVGECPDTIADALILWLVFVFACGLIVAGWIWKFRITGVFGSLLMITISWTIVACHLWAGYITAGIGMYYLLWFALKK